MTRQRWFAYTSDVAVTLTLVAGTLYALIAGAWLATTNTVTGERFGRLYDFQGVIPIGAAAFAVAVGIACGVIIHRTVPAMAATLGILIAVRVLIAVVLRPHFMPAKTLDVNAGEGDPLGDTGAWVLSETMLDLPADRDWIAARIRVRRDRSRQPRISRDSAPPVTVRA